MRFWKKRLQRVAAMVCSVALVASMMPTAVFATESQATTPTTEPTSIVETTPEPSESPENTDATVTTSAPDTGTGSTSAPEATPAGNTDDTKEPEESPEPSEEPTDDTTESGEESTETTDSTTVPNEEGTETTDSTTESGEEGTETTDSTTVPSEEPVESPEPVQQPEKVLMASAPAPQADENGKTIVEAVDGTAANFYADPDKMIWLSVSGGTNISDRQNVTFILNVDGQKETEIEVRGVNRSQAQLRINAPQYDISAEKEGNNGLVECTWNDAEDCYNISNNSYTDTTGDADAYTVVINLTTPTLKDNDAIRIENGDDYYGTFFWAKGTATKSDYKRPLEVYVDGGLVYTATIETPELLTEGSASFWFEANLAQYTSNVTVEPRSLDTVLNTTVKVYLTTKCACGQPNCQCPGGCDCEFGCTKPDCNPGQGENEISTPYGTISYDPDAPDAVKRSLEVEIYVNGQKEYETSEALTVSSAIDGGFAFDDNETKGYYFHSQAKSLNGYDILVRDSEADEWRYVNEVEAIEGSDASSWTPGTGNIKLVYNKEYMLRIYLYTFDRYMTLDVTRLGDTQNYVKGYTISYMARNPVTGEEERYTYPATSFAAGQPQIIPYGREVTVTADCVPYYEATTWRADRVGTDLEFIGEQGNNGSNVSPLRAYGNTVWFTEYGTSDDQLQLYIEDVKEITPPTDEEMKNLLGNVAVAVDCITKDEHETEEYALLDDSYAKADQMGGNSVDNYTYTITVKPDAYVEDYNSKYSDHSNATPPTQEIVFEYVAGKWKVQTETPVTFNVTCEDSKIPDVDVGKLGDEVVTIQCINTATRHPEMKSAILGDLNTDYSVAYGADKKTATITIISADEYVKAYNAEHGKPEHTAASQISDATIKVNYDETAKKWVIDSSDNTATVDVTCEDTAVTSVDLEKTITQVKRGNEVFAGQNIPQMLKVGDVVTYQIKVTNDGDTNLSNVTVTDTFNGAGSPSFGSDGNGSITMNGNGFTWTPWMPDGTLNPGESKTLTYTYTVVDADKGNTITNAATVKGDGDDPTDEDEIKTEVENPDVKVTKSLFAITRNGDPVKVTDNIELKVGDEITYEIKVENTGNVNLSGLTVTDEFSGYAEPGDVQENDSPVADATWQKDTTGTAPNWILTIDDIDLPVEQSKTYTYTYTVNQADAGNTLTNTAAVIGDGTDPDEDKDEDKHPVKDDGTVTIYPADITIYKGGESGSTSVVEDNNGTIAENNSLPTPGFYFDLPDAVNEAVSTYYGVLSAEAVDLSDFITITAKAEDGSERIWNLEKYGEGETSFTTIDGQEHYIYKLVAGDGQDPVRVQFTDDQGNFVTSDDFTLEDAMCETYTMQIYTGSVDTSTLTIKVEIPKKDDVPAQTFHCGYGATQTATLTVRHVNGEQEEVVTDAVTAITDVAKENTPLENAYVVAGSDAVFNVNDSSVSVNQNSVSLLFDDLTTGETETNKAVERLLAIAEDKSGLTGTIEQQAKYLNLVDADNGNAWLTAEEDVTIYWPYPEGTDKNTKFSLLHFDGIDREKAIGGLVSEVEGVTPVPMTITKDDYGISFTTKTFSPFVLMWETEQPSGGGDEPSGGDDGNNDNNNNNTNTNNQTTTVNVANQAAAPAAAPAAVSVPQTSDDMPIGALTAAAVAAAAALVGLLVVRKRRQK